VIPSHANEQATVNGNVTAGTKTARFMDLVRDAGVYPPLSGAVMEFDGYGVAPPDVVASSDSNDGLG